mgnify:CR=1 FL=1
MRKAQEPVDMDKVATVIYDGEDAGCYDDDGKYLGPVPESELPKER